MQHNERPIAENAGFAKRDQLVLANLPLAHQIAVRVHENLPAFMDIDDLVQAAILGLIDAATKYDPDKKAPFFSYAKHRVRGAILDSLRELDWVPRHLRRLHRQVEAATDALRTTLQRTPVEAEVVEMMGVEEECWRRMKLNLHQRCWNMVSWPGAGGDGPPPLDPPDDPESRPDRLYARGQMRAMLQTALRTLPKRSRKVVALYYVSEMTMKEIGDLFGVHETRISQIHRSALDKLAAALESNGVHSSNALTG